MSLGVPLTESDLKEIARVLKSVERIFGDDDKGLTKFGAQFNQIELEVLRPESDEVIGTIRYYDGWLGFFPKEIS